MATIIQSNAKRSTAQRITLVKALAQTLQWKRNLSENPNRYSNWQDICDSELDGLQDALPSGSGIDCGTKIESESTESKIVLTVEFHHMNDGGYYDGWTTHQVIVTPAFDGFNLRITGRNRNDIKDYLHEVYDCALRSLVDIWNDGSVTMVWDEKPNRSFSHREFRYDPIYCGQ